MDKKKVIAIVVAVLVLVVVAVWVLIPKDEPQVAPPPEFPSGTASVITIAPSESPSPTESVSDEPSASPSSQPVETPKPTGAPTDTPSPSETPVDMEEYKTLAPAERVTNRVDMTEAPEPTPTPEIPKIPTTVLPEGATYEEREENMVLAATAYMQAQYELDYSKPYPGFDFERMITLSDGQKRRELKSNATLYRDPRQMDLDDMERMNKDAGGTYKQTVTLNEAWANIAEDIVIVDITTEDSYGVKEYDESSFEMTMMRCDNNDLQWCVAAIDPVSEM